jgi:hypothetical protein
LSESTKQIARRAGTIDSGSKVALRTNALLIGRLSANSNSSTRQQLQQHDPDHRIGSEHETECNHALEAEEMVILPTIAAESDEMLALGLWPTNSVGKAPQQQSPHQIACPTEPSLAMRVLALWVIQAPFRQ